MDLTAFAQLSLASNSTAPQDSTPLITKDFVKLAELVIFGENDQLKQRLESYTTRRVDLLKLIKATCKHLLPQAECISLQNKDLIGPNLDTLFQVYSSSLKKAYATYDQETVNINLMHLDTEQTYWETTVVPSAQGSLPELLTERISYARAEILAAKTFLLSGIALEDENNLQVSKLNKLFNTLHTQVQGILSTVPFANTKLNQLILDTLLKSYLYQNAFIFNKLIKPEQDINKINQYLKQAFDLFMQFHTKAQPYHLAASCRYLILFTEHLITRFPHNDKVQQPGELSAIKSQAGMILIELKKEAFLPSELTNIVSEFKKLQTQIPKTEPDLKAILGQLVRDLSPATLHTNAVKGVHFGTTFLNAEQKKLALTRFVDLDLDLDLYLDLL